MSKIVDTVNENQPEFPTLSFCKTSMNSINFTFNILKLQFNNLKNEWMNYFDTYLDTIYGSLFLGLSFICLIDSLHIFWESIAIILRK